MMTGSKSDLRAAALKARGDIPRLRLAELSKSVEENVLSSPEYQEAQTVACYVSKEEEVSTEGILRRSLATGKRVLVPTIRPSTPDLVFSELRDYDAELAPGTFGVLEPTAGHLRPAPLGNAGLVLVPLVAWDERGHRLGYGKGYFDRALARLTMDTSTMGLGLEAQRVPEIPAEKEDVALMAIATERRIFRVGGERNGRRD